jgi:hypothetical protein
LTHLKTSFGRVRLGRLDVRVTLSTCLASSLSCTVVSISTSDGATWSQRVPLPPAILDDYLGSMSVTIESIGMRDRNAGV